MAKPKPKDEIVALVKRLREIQNLHPVTLYAFDYTVRDDVRQAADAIERFMQEGRG